jgi:DNA-binding NarL/FixJ family response regulator
MDALEGIREVSVAVSCRSRDEGLLAQQLMIACGLNNYTIRPDIRSSLERIINDKPDVAIIIYDKEDERLREFFRILRGRHFEGNRYLPVVAAVWRPSIAQIKQAVGIGASEIVSMPANTEALSRAIYRSVFVGRPFIDVETYFGPCRRRKQIANFGKDKRKVTWDYSHASVRLEG